MRKFDNFCAMFEVLEKADYNEAMAKPLMRTGVNSQFDRCFELAWKVLQQVLRMYSVKEAETGSPREILKLGFRVGFIGDEDVWLDMQEKRNLSTHVYGEEMADEILKAVFESYIPALQRFRAEMKEKIDALENEKKRVKK